MENKVIGIAHHHRAIQLAQTLHDLRWLSSSLDGVPQADDLLDPLLLYIPQDEIQCITIAVKCRK